MTRDFLHDRTRVKVCGMTDPEEVRAAVAAGVDALGFIFVKASPRYIDPERARLLIGGLPPFVDAVGVFMDEDPEAVAETVRFCGLSMAQLHGAESADVCQALSCRVLKAFRVHPETVEPVVPASYEPYAGRVSGFLLDAWHEKKGGGTGLALDWRLLAAQPPPGPLVLAGGLHPDNVAEAIRLARPFAVDVNSGVEKAPGRKDIAKLRRLIEEVRRADAEASTHR